MMCTTCKALRENPFQSIAEFENSIKKFKKPIDN